MMKPGLSIYMKLTDAAIIRRVLGGDTDAYGLLVDRYYDRSARFAMHMLGNAEDAEEALQDTFLRAYESLARYEDRERFGAWLFRILVNRCRTAAARRQRYERRFVENGGALLEGGGTLVGTVVESTADGDAWRDEIWHALAKLPPELREAFLLKHVEELSYEEIMEITNTGMSALKMRVKRACERLRDLLGEMHRVRA